MVECLQYCHNQTIEHFQFSYSYPFKKTLYKMYLNGSLPNKRFLFKLINGFLSCSKSKAVIGKSTLCLSQAFSGFSNESLTKCLDKLTTYVKI